MTLVVLLSKVEWGREGPADIQVRQQQREQAGQAPVAGIPLKHVEKIREKQVVPLQPMEDRTRVGSW